MTYDEALTRATDAAAEAQQAAKSFDYIGDEHPQYASFTSHYHNRATMYAEVAQAWAAVAQAICTRNLEAMEAGL